MRTRIVLFAVAVAVLVVGRPVYAHGGDGPHHRRGSYAGLDLTADQQKQLSDLRESLDRKMLPLRNDMFAKSSELRQLWAAPAPDRKALQEKQARLDQVRKQMQDARTDHRLAVLNILTPAQREKFQATGGPGYGPHQGGGRGGRCGGGGYGLGAGPGGEF